MVKILWLTNIATEADTSSELSALFPLMILSKHYQLGWQATDKWIQEM